MSKSKLELVLECLINEEQDKAAELLHNIVVDKSRAMYEEIVDEDDNSEEEEELEESEDEGEEEAVEEAFGGDAGDDFGDDIRSDDEEIESDEMYDGADEGEEGEEGEVEDRVEDLEAALSDLRAEFDRLMSDELEEPNHAELASELDGGYEGDESYEEGFDMMEATKLQDQVSDPGLGQEGKLAGTGKNSKSGSVDKASPYTNAPSKNVDANGASPVKVNSGSMGNQAASAKKETTEDNIDVPEKDQSADMGTEGKLAGTGKNSKSGSVDKTSPLSTAPKK